MKIIITPDSCRESLSATEVAQTTEKGFREIFPDAQYVSMPIVDDGEGTVEAMVAAMQGAEHSAWVTGPLGERVGACWGMLSNGVTASIEMATASGPGLVPSGKRNPLITTSRGIGELILQALRHDAKQIIIGIGSSATNGDGAGMMQVPGARLCDAGRQEIDHDGGSLSRLSRIDPSAIDPRLHDKMIHVVRDITNPLVDECDILRILDPQKEATEVMIVKLDRNLTYFADVTKASLQVDVRPVPGARAVGDMDAASITFFSVELRSGIEIVTEALKLEEQIHDCLLVITGEGWIGSQPIYGKVPVGIARAAKECRKPVIDIAGSLTHNIGVVYQHGIDTALSVLTTVSMLKEAFHGAFDNTYRVSRNIAATLRVGMTIEG